ncbi:MAG: hypothetical protein WCP85_20525 [Mariniphaga sp.]
MIFNNKILSIINSTQQKLGNEKLSNILTDCLRIALLRNDYANHWWIKMEFLTENQEEFLNYLESIKPKFSVEEFEKNALEYLKAWTNERKTTLPNSRCSKEQPFNILALSIYEIENKIANAENRLKGLTVSQNLTSEKTYEIECSNLQAKVLCENAVNDYKNILGRIQSRVSDYLNKTEYELISGKTSDIFQQTKDFVDRKLAEISPDVLQKFLSINLVEGNKETYAQSLVTCRRVLQSFADSIYPASSKIVKGQDGKERVLNEDKYIGRIWQYIYETIGKSTSTQMLESQLVDLGNRVDQIYKLSNKGIHTEVDLLEANQCIIQTYLIIGDILRLKKQ